MLAFFDGFGKSREPNHVTNDPTRRKHTPHMAAVGGGGGEHGRLLHCVGDHVLQHKQSIAGEHQREPELKKEETQKKARVIMARRD